MSESDDPTAVPGALDEPPQVTASDGVHPDPTNPAAKPGTPASPTPRKKRRVPRWLKVFGVVGLLLGLLVLLAPTLAGTSPVRSIALGKVNEKLNGKVEVSGLSLGWFTGLKVSGIRVLDAAGQPVVQLSSLTTSLSLLDVIRGNFSIGDAVVDGLDFDVRREADGQLNIAKLAKPETSPPKPKSPAPEQPKPKVEKPPAKLPNVSGHILVRNSKGIYTDAVSGQRVQIASIDGDVRIPDINSAIENSLSVVAVAPNGQRGTLKVAGSADVVDGNEVHPERANVNETITLDGLAMSALAPFVPSASINRLEGVTNADVSIQMTAGQSGTLKATLTTTNLAASGPALNGDTFATPEFSIVVPPTSIDMSPGFGTWQNWPVRTGGATPAPITVRIKHDGYDDTVTLGLSATPQSLMNAAGNMKPGSNGEVDLNVAFNLGGLAKQLPHLFPEHDGQRLSSGTLKQSTQIKLTPDAATLAQSLNLADLSLSTLGGKSESLQPINEDLRLSTLGGGWAMPDLRDLHLGFASGFAQADFGGKELTQLKGTATGDLAKAQRELGQILPMNGLTLGGTFKVDLTSGGDVVSPTAPIDLGLVATFAGLQLDGVGGMERVRQNHTQFEAHAQVVRGDAGIEALNGVRVSARSGQSPQQLTLDSQLSADVKYVSSSQPNPATGKVEMVRIAQVPRYTIDRVNVDLPAVQRDFPNQFASLAEQGVRLDAGAIALAGSGSYSSDVMTFAVKGGINGLTLSRVAPVAATASATLAPVPPAPAASSFVLRDYTLSIDAAGTSSSAANSAGTRITRLSLADNQKMLSLQKGQGDVVVPSGPGGTPSGEVVLGADLKKLLDVSHAMSAPPSSPDTGPALQSGRIDGTLRLSAAPGPDKLVLLSGKLDATGISVRTEGEPIRDEKLALTMSVRSTPDFGVLNVDGVTVDGRLVRGRIFDTIVDRPAGNAPNAGPLASVRKANAVLDFPALADLHALILAISPPAQTTPSKTAQAAKPATPEKPAPQGRILSGSASAKLTLDHQGNNVTITPEITAKGLSLGAGDVSKNVGDVVVRTVVQMVPAYHAPTNATFLQSLRELTIPTLTLTGARSDIKLDRPLVMKDPATALAALGSATTQPAGKSPPPAPSAASALSAVLIGRVDMAELLSTVEAWQGAKPGTIYPYVGDMTVRQELSTAAGGAVSLVGRADVNNFATLGEKGATFAEPHVAFANNLVLDSTANLLRINDLSFSTETTHAVRLIANGVVHEPDTARRLENVVVKLDYDAAGLWNILRPLMDPETGGKSLAEFTLTGKRLEQITLSGSYPANDPHAIHSLHADGGFALDTLAGRGLTVAGLDLHFLLDQGVLRLEHIGAPVPANAAPTTTPTEVVAKAGEPPPANLPPGARCNGSGLISFHGIAVDLNGEHPRLNTPDNHPLIYHVSINPVVANTLLGRFVNPGFAGSDQAKGVLDVTVVSCKNLALDKAMQLANVADSGRAEIHYSLTDLLVSQPELVGLVAKIKPNALNANGFSGNIRDGRLVLQGGQAKNDMTFSLDKFALKFNGGIGLAENKLYNFNVTLPPELFAAINRDFGKNVPKEGYRIALSGTTDNWAQSLSQAIPPILADLGVRSGLGNVLDRALGGKKDKSRSGDTRDGAEPNAVFPDAPAQRNAEPAAPEDALGQLLDRALSGGSKKKADKEKNASGPRTAQDKAASTQPTTQPLSKKERDRLKKEEKRQRELEKNRDR